MTDKSARLDRTECIPVPEVKSDLWCNVFLLKNGKTHQTHAVFHDKKEAEFVGRITSKITGDVLAVIQMPVMGTECQ